LKHEGVTGPPGVGKSHLAIALGSQAYRQGSPELKFLIKKQIVSIAYQTLGDFNSKIFLSLLPINYKYIY